MMDFLRVYDDFIVVNGGMKRVSELIPGLDTVIEYGSNKLLEIRTTAPASTRMLEVRLSDYTDATILASDYNEGPIELCPVDFGNLVLSDDLYKLDPYTVGALLMYGDYEDEFINLPGVQAYSTSYIMNRNKWTLAEKLGTNGKIYFYYAYSIGRLVRWEEIFKDVKCKAMDSRNPLFPLEYATGSFRTRRHLLSGVFDVGFSKEPFDNRLQISCPYEERLVSVQSILRSLGIVSQISLYNNVYILTVMGQYDNTTGFFYNIDHLERMVNNNDWNMYRDSSRLHIEMVINEYDCEVWVPVFADDRPHHYIDHNFLRRSSIPV